MSPAVLEVAALEQRMAAPSVAPPPLFSPERVRAAVASLRPRWSPAAALRALRALLVIPTLFAIVTQVIHNRQMPLYATFGGFAALVLVDFSGSRRDKLVAYLALGAAGSAMIAIGTAVSSSAALASPIALVVVFVVLMCGVFGSNASSGTTAVLLSFILPAASPGGMLSQVPARLAGWWLAIGAGCLAVMVLSPRPAGDRVRANAARVLAALSIAVDAIRLQKVDDSVLRSVGDARDAFLESTRGAPTRPTGVGAADQAIADLAETVQWAVSLIDEIAREGPDLTSFDPTDLRLLATTAAVLRAAAQLLSGASAEPPIGELESLMGERDESVRTSSGNSKTAERATHLSYHARMIAIAARTAALDALAIARRRPAEATEATGGPTELASGAGTPRYLSSLYSALRIHSGIASMTFQNAVRGAIAIAAAIAVADLTNVQHGFWVVLGALSVLRTSAVSIGVNAWRAMVGTAVGFAIGAAILAGVGRNTDALWAVFPVCTAVAAYAPGTTPFAVGQAAFTMMLTVIFNLIAPVGWAIGVVRVEDVALGVGVSLVAGVLFWPRGASGVVREDLADAFHYDGLFLVQSTAWALGRRTSPPDAGANAARSDRRLGDAMRSLMAEQGVRRVPPEEAWRLVSGVGRLRSTARSLAVAPHHLELSDEVSVPLLEQSVRLAGLCDAYASRIADRPATVAQELAGLAFVGAAPQASDGGYSGWVNEHLHDVREELDSLAEPVGRVAESAKVPWWR